MRRINETIKKITKLKLLHYILAGGTSFTVEYSLFLALYYVMGSPAVFANTVSFIIGLLVNFILNKFWVFKSSKQKMIQKQFVPYVSLALFNLVTTNIGIYYLVNAQVPAFVAKLLLVGLIISWNFIIFKNVIFKDNS